MITGSLGVDKIGRFDFTHILAGDFPRISEEVIVTGTAGQVMPIGTILYKDATTGKCTPAVTTNTTVHAVLSGELVFPEAGDMVGVGWLSGHFIGPNCTVGNGTWTDFVAKARAGGIYLSANVAKAPNQ